MAKETQTRTPARPIQRPAAKPVTASARSAANRKTTAAKNVRPFHMPFESKNVFIILAGVGVIALGYIIMSMSPTMSPMALTIAPIILILGYCVVVPYGIMYGARAFNKAKAANAAVAANGSDGVV